MLGSVITILSYKQSLGTIVFYVDIFIIARVCKFKNKLVHMMTDILLMGFVTL